MKIKMVMAVGLFLAVGTGVSYSAEKIKIGYIDVQKILNESQAGIEAKQNLKQEFEERQKILEERDRNIKALKDELESKGSALSSEARAKKEAELKNRQEEFRQLLTKMEMELQRKDFELTQKILKDLQGIIEDIGKKEGYHLILEKNEGMVLYSPPEYDLSERIIRRYDKEKKSEEKGSR